MATVVLLFPLLGGGQGSESLSRLFEDYVERSAATSAATLLESGDGRTAGEQQIMSFLLANDLTELGLHELATRELRRLVDSPELGPDAFLALVRLLDEDENDDALLDLARRARWTGLGDEEFAEAVFRVARACMRAERYAEAREWLKPVPPRSAYALPSRYLLAQIEYALGRPPQSIDAVEDVFRTPDREPSTEWLRDRTAIFAGEMLTELGLYPDALAVFAWPRRSSPFRARAEREAAVARTLAAIDAHGEIDRDWSEEPTTSAPTAEMRARVARELERAWPSRSRRETRRRFAIRAARRAYDRQQGFGWSRALDVVWRSLPPVAVYEAARAARRSTLDDDVVMNAEAGSFFAPRPEIAKVLTAIALASDAAPATPRSCTAKAIAARAARVLGGTEPSPADLPSLARATRECRPDDAARQLPELRAKLDKAIEDESERRRRSLHAQRYLVEERLAAARLERQEMLEAARGEKR